MVRTIALLSALALSFAACGNDDDGLDAGGSGTTESTTTTTTTDGTTTSTTASDGPLPGEPVDIFPHEGATLAVVGVAADDVLNVRSGPGVDFEVEFTLGPLHRDATATGNNRQLPDGPIWAEVRDDGRTGWANTAFLLQPGRVRDVTAELYPTPADRPSAETMVDLADVVAEQVGSEEPASEVTVVDGPEVGDLAEITVDVIGLGDDAIGGYRLHLFAEEDPGGESFTLRTVESHLLCSRGVTDDGRCT